MSIRPQIPDVQGVKDESAARILKALKLVFDSISGRSQTKITTLGPNANYYGVVSKVNELINRLQSDDVSGGPKAPNPTTITYLTANQKITLSGDVLGTGTTAIPTTISENAVTNAKFRQGTGLSVVGVTGTATANVADIVGAADQVLRVSPAGAAVVFGAIDLSKSAAVTGVLTNSLVGRTSAGTGVPEMLGTAVVKTMLNLSGTNSGDQTITLTGAVLGTGSGSIATTLSVITTAGTYTPAITQVANLTTSTAYQCKYMRVGGTVSVWGKVDIQPTVGTASTQLGVSLPVASAFAVTGDCAGVAFCPTIAGQGAAILADVANARAQLQFISGDITSQPMYFNFGYQVL